MKSFVTMLNADNAAVKTTRVSNFTASAVADSAALLEAKRAEIRQKQNHLAELMDIAPENTMDLSTKLSKIDTGKLMRDIHATQVEIKLAQEVLEIMVDTHNALFPEYPEKAEKYASAAE